MKTLGDAPRGVREKWAAWLAIVEQSGPAGLRQIKGFHDEALSGVRQAQRSSRLNRAYRVIYTVQEQQLTVQVEDVTKHDYR